LNGCPFFVAVRVVAISFGYTMDGYNFKAPLSGLSLSDPPGNNKGLAMNRFMMLNSFIYPFFTMSFPIIWITLCT
jgi:hypothetical protein